MKRVSEFVLGVVTGLFAMNVVIVILIFVISHATFISIFMHVLVVLLACFLTYLFTKE